MNLANTFKPLLTIFLLQNIFLEYLVFQSFDFERTLWRLFQKRVVSTKLDIHVFILWNLIYNSLHVNILVFIKKACAMQVL